MNEIAIPGMDDESQLFKRVLAQYDAPAYIRRARSVEEAIHELTESCRRQRDERLQMVRLRIGVLHGLCGEWSVWPPGW